MTINLDDGLQQEVEAVSKWWREKRTFAVMGLFLLGAATVLVSGSWFPQLCGCIVCGGCGFVYSEWS